MCGATSARSLQGCRSHLRAVGRRTFCRLSPNEGFHSANAPLKGRDRVETRRVPAEPRGVQGIADRVALLRGRASGPQILFVLRVCLLQATIVSARAHAEVIKVILPGVAIPARGLGSQTKKVVNHVLKVEGAVARAQLKDLRQKAA